jgi:hypothetical protein
MPSLNKYPTATTNIITEIIMDLVTLLFGILYILFFKRLNSALNNFLIIGAILAQILL